MFVPEGSQLVRPLLGNTPRYKRIWSPRIEPIYTEHCIQGAVLSVMAAAPNKWEISPDLMKPLLAKHNLLGVMEEGINAGYFGSVARCSDTDDLIDSIIRRGPVVVGLRWSESFDSPNEDGSVESDGRFSARIYYAMANGYWPRHPDLGDVVVLTTTWGKNWGLRGRCYIPVSLLNETVIEAALPVDVTPFAAFKNEVEPVEEIASH